MTTPTLDRQGRSDRRRRRAVGLLAGLALAGCGSDGAANRISDLTVGATAAESGPGAIDPGTTEPETTEPETTASEAGRTASASAPDDLVAALDGLAATDGLRMTLSSSMVMRIPALGIDSSSEIDPDRPTMVAEQDAAGRRHVWFDMGRMLASMAPDPTVAAALDVVHYEMWQVDDLLVLDLTGYQPLVDVNPSADLGLFAPGVASVDLSAARAVDESAIELLTGSTLPDPTALASALPAVIGAVADVDGRPGVYVATGSYADLLRGLGTDPEVSARSMSAGMAPSIGMDVDALTAVVVDFFDSVPVEVELTVEGGLVTALTFDADLSDIYQHLVDQAVEEGADARTVEQIATLFADAELRVASLMSFEPDAAVSVEPPAGPYEDRTELALVLIRAATGGVNADR